MNRIILSTLNARYIHSAFGLRYLYANMEELQLATKLMEFTIETRPIDIAEKLIDERPEIIGFGVYIWNVEQTRQVISIVKSVAPHIIIVLGGPEVSYENIDNPVTTYADHVIAGSADHSFRELCIRLFNTSYNGGNTPKYLQSDSIDLKTIKLPYEYYTDDDLANRIIYVEASRGCPFKCEFCLSSLDKTAWQFDLDLFLDAMQRLYDRGARTFKFVDRTFNLKIESTCKILEFFLERLDDTMFLHFELIPDHLPQKLKSLIRQFPQGALQFEIGIQSFNPQVQKNIARRQDNDKSKDNISWLRKHSHAHLHTDLIVGLPGEDLHSFAAGFDELVKLDPHEIQVGILKRLKGTPISRHTVNYEMHYNPDPPYNILSTNQIDFQSMQKLSRFARYWDIIANSGRFKFTLPTILGDTPFNRFFLLSEWLYEETGQTHRIALARLFKLLYRAMTEVLSIEHHEAASQLELDFKASGLKGHASMVIGYSDNDIKKGNQKLKLPASQPEMDSKAGKRQLRHIINNGDSSLH